jgi:hypothetical protein
MYRDRISKKAVSQALAVTKLRHISEREASEHDRISKLTFVPVEGLAPDQMRALGTKPGLCHANCHYLERIGKAERVIGWLRLFDEEDGYLLHSVVRMAGKLVDVTPARAVTKMETFATDPSLSARGERIFAPDGKEAFDEVLSRAQRDAIVAYKRRIARGMGKVSAAMVDDDGKGGLLRFLIDVQGTGS